MSTNVNQFSQVDTVLASTVADDGTFTVSYPSGTSQLSFNAGLAGTDHVMIVNGNDKWTAGDPGFSVSFGASDITITNLTGASLAAGSEITLQFDRKDGNGRIPYVIPLPPLSTITAADIVTECRPGIDGYIEYAEFVTTIAVTTAAKAADLNLEIDTTNVTGGVIALTSAAATPKGKVIGSSAVTGNNRITRESKLSLEAANVTAFSEGEGYVVVYIRADPSNAY
jgi:hypothetical protein